MCIVQKESNKKKVTREWNHELKEREKKKCAGEANEFNGFNEAD